MSKGSNGPRVSFTDVLMNSMFLRAPARLREISAETESTERTDEDRVVHADQFVAAKEAKNEAKTTLSAKPRAKAATKKRGSYTSRKKTGSKSRAGRVHWMGDDWKPEDYRLIRPEDIRLTKPVDYRLIRNNPREAAALAEKFQPSDLVAKGILYSDHALTDRLRARPSDTSKKDVERGSSAPKDEE